MHKRILNFLAITLSVFIISFFVFPSIFFADYNSTENECDSDVCDLDECIENPNGSNDICEENNINKNKNNNSNKNIYSFKNKDFKWYIDKYGKTDEGFVTLFYNKALKRNPNKQELNLWKNYIEDNNTTGYSLVSQIIFSKECQTKTSFYTNEQYINFLYNTLFNRAPDLNGMNTWLKLMKAGMTKESVLSGFTQSEEFVNLCKEFGIKPYKDYKNSLK